MSTKKDNKGRNLKEGESQMSDGRYRYRYTDKFGNRKVIYAWKLVGTDKTPQGKKDGLCLRKQELSIKRDIEDDINFKYEDITVVELIEKYLRTKPSLALSTINNYYNMLEVNIKPNKFGKLKVKNVKRSDVLYFYAHLYNQKKFSVGTIQLYQNLIFPSFQLGVDDNMIRSNPCKNCMKEYSKSKNGDATKRALTRDEQKVLMEYVKDSDIYNCHYPLIAFMLGTGCRIGEALGMTWNDIDFENKCVNVNHQVIYKKKDGRIQFYSARTKTGETRVIPIKNDLIAILQKHKADTFFTSKASPFCIDKYFNFVFINREGKIPTPNSIVRTLHGITNAYNKEMEESTDGYSEYVVMLPTFSPHTLRHTFCTRMAENGIDIKVLQSLMGHKTINVTMQVYNHITIERSKQAVNNVESTLVV